VDNDQDRHEIDRRLFEALFTALRSARGMPSSVDTFKAMLEQAGLDAYWPEIRAAILERAKNAAGRPCCEECGVPNRSKIMRDADGDEDSVIIILTIAHLDHAPENCDPSNLRAWCQRCHNRYDAPMRRAGNQGLRPSATRQRRSIHLPGDDQWLESVPFTPSYSPTRHLPKGARVLIVGIWTQCELVTPAESASMRQQSRSLPARRYGNRQLDVKTGGLARFDGPNDGPNIPDAEASMGPYLTV
jgi:hypothetical protein